MSPAWLKLDVTSLAQPGDYWKRPDPKDRGDKSPDEIYSAVGMALSAWEELENDFAILFANLVESTSPASARAYGAIASASGRRDALQSAAEIYFLRYPKTPPEVNEKFKKLMNHFQSASARRNEIAHAHVMGFTFDRDDRGHFLIPSEYNTRKTEPLVYMPEVFTIDNVLGTDYRFTSVDVVSFCMKFQSLRQTVMTFHFGLRAESRK